MKTIDINAKEWFQKTYGNSYFSAVIVIDYGMETEETIELPFQYGYGDQYVHMSLRKLEEKELIKTDEKTALWRYCQENEIILRTNKQENCLKRDL